jgi:hypothetical protein
MSKKIGIKPVYMMDIGQVWAFCWAMPIGRIGCQLSGDGDWGIVAAAIPELVVSARLAYGHTIFPTM